MIKTRILPVAAAIVGCAVFIGCRSVSASPSSTQAASAPPGHSGGAITLPASLDNAIAIPDVALSPSDDLPDVESPAEPMPPSVITPPVVTIPAEVEPPVVTIPAEVITPAQPPKPSLIPGPNVNPNNDAAWDWQYLSAGTTIGFIVTLSNGEGATAADAKFLEGTNLAVGGETAVIATDATTGWLTSHIKLLYNAGKNDVHIMSAIADLTRRGTLHVLSAEREAILNAVIGDQHGNPRHWVEFRLP